MTPAEAASIATIVFALGIGATIVTPKPKPEPPQADTKPPVEVVTEPTLRQGETPKKIDDVQDHIKAIERRLKALDQKIAKETTQ
jgi:hypothetical protein